MNTLTLNRISTFATGLVLAALVSTPAFAQSGQIVPPYGLGDFGKGTIGVATADAAVDQGRGTVGVRATAFWGSGKAWSRVGSWVYFPATGYYRVSGNIRYVSKYNKTPLAIVTLHAFLDVDGGRSYDDNLGTTGLWPWEGLPSISNLWWASRDRSYTVVRYVSLSQGWHTLRCGLEDRVVGSWNQSGGIVGVGDVTAISYSKL